MFCRVFEFRTVATFHWAFELLDKTLQQVLMRLLVGVWHPTLLAFKLVLIERVEREPVADFRRLEVALAVGAVAVIFQPPFDAIATKQCATFGLAALLGLEDHIQANETLKVFIKFAFASFGGDRIRDGAIDIPL